MKLLSRSPEECIFLIGKRERQMLTSVLKHYPVLSTTYHTLSKGGTDESSEDEELLREALAEQQKENRQQLQAMLSEPDRFTEDSLGYRFTLKLGEAEWLLQVLNDIRVGSWVKLGSPRLALPIPTALTEENVKLCWAMEIAGLFESELLQALNSSP